MASKAASIPTATGIAWSEWDSWLIEQGALELPHPQIAKLALKRVHDLGITTHAANGKPFNRGWWAQTIAIEFGHQHGLREKGQQSTGDHAVSASKKVVGSLDELLRRWLDAVAGRTEFDGVGLAGEPSVRSTEKWRYWRARLADGSSVNVDISADRIAVQHAGLGSADERERWRPFWKSLSTLAWVAPSGAVGVSALGSGGLWLATTSGPPQVMNLRRQAMSRTEDRSVKEAHVPRSRLPRVGSTAGRPADQA